MDLTKEQKQELQRIVGDKYANGAFAGMIFNAVINEGSVGMEEAIARALDVRLKMKSMAAEDYSDVPEV